MFFFVCLSRYVARHRKLRRCVSVLNLGGTGIRPPDSFSYHSNFVFVLVFVFVFVLVLVLVLQQAASTGDIFYCSGSRQLNHSSSSIVLVLLLTFALYSSIQHLLPVKACSRLFFSVLRRCPISYDFSDGKYSIKTVTGTTQKLQRVQNSAARMEVQASKRSYAKPFFCKILLSEFPEALLWSVSAHAVVLWLGSVVGYRTLRPQDTSDPHETLQHRLKTLLLQKRATRHFCIRSTKSWDTLIDPGQFRQDTAPPVIRLKVGAEVSWCQNVLWPKCLAPV